MTKREQTLETLKNLDLNSEWYGNVRKLIDKVGWDESSLAARKTEQAREGVWRPERVFSYFRSLLDRMKAGETVALRPGGLQGYRERKRDELKEAALDREHSGVIAPEYEPLEEYYDPRCEPFYDSARRERDYEDNQF